MLYPKVSALTKQLFLILPEVQFPTEPLSNSSSLLSIISKLEIISETIPPNMYTWLKLICHSKKELAINYFKKNVINFQSQIYLTTKLTDIVRSSSILIQKLVVLGVSLLTKFIFASFFNEDNSESLIQLN